MKKLLVICFVSIILLSLTSCGEQSYDFKKPIEEIERIEIISAKNRDEVYLIKTLSKDEQSDFIKKFQEIKFNSYVIGDPMSVSGNAVKITYQNGDYEIICYRCAEYIKDQEIYFLGKHCSEEEFNALIDEFKR